MRNEFYKATCNLDILHVDVDLIFLEKWPEKCFKIFFNPIANIIATQGTKTDIQHQKKDKERKQINLFHNSTPQLPDKSKKNTKTLVCYLCSQDHRIMGCIQFKLKTAVKRKDFVKEQNLYFNCLSKAHMFKECQLEFRCLVDDSKLRHHTLLDKEPVDNQNANS